jgi:outer membrane biogenesis lipoprotein LolB
MHAMLANLRHGLLASIVVLLGGCASETLFQSNFDGTPPGQPPAHAQQVGTADAFGGAGQVTVVDGPGGTGGKWVQIGRPVADTNIAGLVGRMTAIRGPGHYVFTGFFYMPTGTGLASINFETPNPIQPGLETFLHLDLTTNNNVRVDDNPNITFGSFTRDQPFILEVDLDTTVLPAKAHIVLSGATASGVFDYTTQPVFQQASQQFGDVRVWMGFPWLGFFDATQLVVTHRTN